jgi:SAM-dependent methyltransferase
MNSSEDAYGEQLRAQYEQKIATAEAIERDDGHIDLGSDAGLYFTGYDEWPESERNAVDRSKGRVLDIGCGAGRHSLYLRSRGLDVTGIDSSPGAVDICKLKGLEKALVRPIAEVDKFGENSFDTILMLGNNFGLLGGFYEAKVILGKLGRITSHDAQMIAGTRDPYKTDDEAHLQYHKLNKDRGRMPGQIRMRVRYGKIVGEWFDYLFVSPNEMEDVLEGTGWQIDEILGTDGANYIAVIGKAS